MNIASLKAAKGAKGFTLVELIAVLVILGIIAAIAIPTYRTIIDNAQWRAVQADTDSFDRGIRLLAATYEDGSLDNAGLTNPQNLELVNAYIATDFPTDKAPDLYQADNTPATDEENHDVAVAVFTDASGDKAVCLYVDPDYSAPFDSVRADQDEDCNALAGTDYEFEPEVPAVT